MRQGALAIVFVLLLSSCQTSNTGNTGNTGKIYDRGETHKISVEIPARAPSIGSDYSASSEYLGRKRSGPHVGIDILAPVGYPVLAAADGEVIESKYESRIGREGFFVVIQHENGLGTSYSHMAKTNVDIGQMVKRGDQIGDVGTTGLDHLHFMVLLFRRHTNPHSYWLGGEGKIVCFDKSLNQKGNDDFIFTYPVPCHD